MIRYLQQLRQVMVVHLKKMFSSYQFSFIIEYLKLMIYTSLRKYAYTNQLKVLPFLKDASNFSTKLHLNRQIFILINDK